MCGPAVGVDEGGLVDGLVRGVDGAAWRRQAQLHLGPVVLNVPDVAPHHVPNAHWQRQSLYLDNYSIRRQMNL